MKRLKHIVFRIKAVLVIALMLISLSGINLDLHICQGHVKTIGVNSEAEGCLAMYSGNSCLPIHQDGIGRSACCANSNIYYFVDIDAKHPKSSNQNFFYTAIKENELFSYSDYSLFARNNFHLFRPPPDINLDLNILYQNFLI